MAHLVNGRNVAAIVPDEDRLNAPYTFRIGDTTVIVVDGEEDDLRFLDPTPSLVLLKPKGPLARGGLMVHANLIARMQGMWRDAV
jgi:hypothetical protein